LDGALTGELAQASPRRPIGRPETFYAA